MKMKNLNASTFIVLWAVHVMSVTRMPDIAAVGVKEKDYDLLISIVKC